MNRLTGFAIPEDGGLALVGYADGGDIGGFHSGFGQSSFGDTELRLPDFIGVMLDPAGLRKELFEFLLGQGANAAGMVEDNGTGAGSPLIKGKYEGHR